jgi:hypothetical protein
MMPLTVWLPLVAAAAGTAVATTLARVAELWRTGAVRC